MRHRVYLGFAIANTILRPFTCLLLYRIFRERDLERIGIRGLFADLIPVEIEGDSSRPQATAPPGQTQQGYQPIDSNIHSTKA
jgi:hypothetical protein